MGLFGNKFTFTTIISLKLFEKTFKIGSEKPKLLLVTKTTSVKPLFSVQLDRIFLDVQSEHQPFVLRGLNLLANFQKIGASQDLNF